MRSLLLRYFCRQIRCAASSSSLTATIVEDDGIKIVEQLAQRWVSVPALAQHITFQKSIGGFSPTVRATRTRSGFSMIGGIGYCLRYSSSKIEACPLVAFTASLPPAA
jgi:hypothetical protein